MPTDTRPPRGGVLLAAIVLLGLALRLIGMGYGLPHVYNPDEIAIMNRALALPTNHFNPQNFLYPTLYFYALLAWEGAFAVVARVAGLFDSFAAFERSYFVDPSWIFLAGRALTALCGTATVWVTGRLGLRVFDRSTGLLAALFLAVMPLAVRDAHYVKHDVPATLLVVLAHLAVARALFANTRPTARDWMLAGAATGLAISTHYYTAPLLLTLVMGAWIAPAARGRAWTMLAVMAAAAIAFVVTSPFYVLEPVTVVRDFVANRQIVVDRATGSSGVFGSLAHYLAMLGRDAAGAAIAAMAIIGAVLSAAGGRRRSIVMLVFPVAFLLLIANTYPATRYLNPMLPFVAIAAAAAISRLARANRVAAVAAAIMAIAAAGQALTLSIRTDRFFGQTDTRTLALEWIARDLPQTATIAVQPYSVPLRMSRPALVEALTAHLGSADRASIKFQKQLALDPYPSPAWRTIYLGSGGLDVDRIYVDPAAFQGEAGLGPLRNLAVEYVVLKKYNEPDASMTSLGAALERGARRVAVFSPYRADVSADRVIAVAPFLHNTDARIDPALERPGPTIEIWKLD